MRPTPPFLSRPQGARPSSAESRARTDALPSLGDPEKWKGLAPSKTRWASEKPLAGWRGAPHRLFPQRAPKPDAKAPAPPKQGAVQPGTRLGRGAPGEAECRRSRGIRGWREDWGELQTQPGRRPAQCLQRSCIPGQPVPPRPAPPDPGAHRSAAAAQGPAASPPLPPCAPRPGREVSGFSPRSPDSPLPPATRGPRARSKAE